LSNHPHRYVNWSPLGTLGTAGSRRAGHGSAPHSWTTRPAEFLAKEAVEWLITYADWLSRKLERGLLAVEPEELIEHDEVCAPSKSGFRS